MSQITRDRIRLALNSGDHTDIQDALSSATPSFYNGNDLQFELALFVNGALADLGNISSITLEVKPDDDITGLPLMAATVASADLNNTLTLDQWNSADPAMYQGLVTFTNDLTSLDLDGQDVGTFWLVISALTTDTPAQLVTLATGPLQVIENGANTAPPVFVQNPLYLTVAQSDARYSNASGKLATTGGTLTGPLQFSGTGQYGLRLNNVTTAQKNAIAAPAVGALLYDTTLNLPAFYDNASTWRTFVTSVNTLTGDAVLTTSNVAEGSNEYFTNARAIAATLTGFTAGAGVISSSDTVLSAIQKLAAGSGSGTVTSVGLTMPGIFTVSGSPITGSDTFVVSLASQFTNTIFAGPSSGGGAQPAFRALAAADIPSLAESKITNLVSDLAAKLALAGGTMTGALTLTSATPSGYQATSYNFINANYLALAGGTLTGALNTVDLIVNAANAPQWAGTPSSANHLVNKTYADQFAAKAGATFTGNLQFSGTAIAGLVANSLTSTQVAALTPSNGMLVYNTTLSQLQYYNGSWNVLSVGSSAANWYNGAGAPSGGTGINGDYYLNDSNGAVYQKSSGSWSVIWAGTLPTSGGTVTGLLTLTNTGYQLAFGSGSYVWQFEAQNSSPAELDIYQNGSLIAYFKGADFWTQSGKIVAAGGLGVSGTGYSVDSAGYFYLKNRTPSSSGDTATINTFWYDSSYLYMAVGVNTIKRVALSSF